MDGQPITQSEGALLCTRCSTIDFDALLSGGTALELGRVTDWSIDSCTLCGFLATQLSLKRNREDKQTNYSWINARAHFRGSLTPPLLNPLGGKWLQLNEDAKIFQYFATQSNFSHSSHLRLLEADRIDFGILRGWLAVCHDSHAETCGSWKSSVVPHMKLIDCQTLQIISATDAKYATLSKFSFKRLNSHFNSFY